ncbi:hypothetical protein FB451DRAFT_1163829 [Mycena latifolia]|nr:hypothetical protein FB451DRAFT_1163829 [Mycena latifolia]
MILAACGVSANECRREEGANLNPVDTEEIPPSTGTRSHGGDAFRAAIDSAGSPWKGLKDSNDGTIVAPADSDIRRAVKFYFVIQQDSAQAHVFHPAQSAAKKAGISGRGGRYTTAADKCEKNRHTSPSSAHRTSYLNLPARCENPGNSTRWIVLRVRRIMQVCIATLAHTPPPRLRGPAPLLAQRDSQAILEHASDAPLPAAPEHTPGARAASNAGGARTCASCTRRLKAPWYGDPPAAGGCSRAGVRAAHRGAGGGGEWGTADHEMRAAQQRSLGGGSRVNAAATPEGGDTDGAATRQ